MVCMEDMTPKLCACLIKQLSEFSGSANCFSDLLIPSTRPLSSNRHILKSAHPLCENMKHSRSCNYSNQSYRKMCKLCHMLLLRDFVNEVHANKRHASSA